MAKMRAFGRKACGSAIICADHWLLADWPFCWFYSLSCFCISIFRLFSIFWLKHIVHLDDGCLCMCIDVVVCNLCTDGQCICTYNIISSKNFAITLTRPIAESLYRDCLLSIILTVEFDHASFCIGHPIITCRADYLFIPGLTWNLRDLGRDQASCAGWP